MVPPVGDGGGDDGDNGWALPAMGSGACVGTVARGEGLIRWYRIAVFWGWYLSDAGTLAHAPRPRSFPFATLTAAFRCPVLLWYAVSCAVPSRPDLCCYFLFFYVLSCPVLFCSVLFCSVLFYPVFSCPVFSCRFLSVSWPVRQWFCSVLSSSVGCLSRNVL